MTADEALNAINYLAASTLRMQPAEKLEAIRQILASYYTQVPS